MSYNDILTVITAFYDKAKIDVMIGYHFRFIEDFDQHIPRIADFWNLQLTGELEDRSHLPFDLLKVHQPLGIKRGEIGRWMVLFQETLKESQLTPEQQQQWLDKAEKFKQKIEVLVIQP